MAKLIFLCLLIIYAVFAQEIGKSSEENAAEKQLHLREKRMAHTVMDGNPHRVPSVVYVLKNGRYYCVGIILTHEIILTSANCIYKNNGVYTVAVPEGAGDHGNTLHEVTSKNIYSTFNESRFENDLGILTVRPPINERNNINRIRLFDGHLAAHSPAILTGMGISGHALRSVRLEIIGTNRCQHEYREFRPINERHVCAVGFDRHGIGFNGDSGGPLIVGGQLVGIYSWTGRTRSPVNPDVFMNLQFPYYKTWIEDNIRAHHG